MLTIEATAGSRINDTCRKAVYVAEWATREADLASLDGQWVAISPVPNPDKGEHEADRYTQVGQWDPADRDAIPEGTELYGDQDGWFAFWKIIVGQLGQEAARKCVLVKVEDDEWYTTVKFDFNEIEIVQAPIDSQDEWLHADVNPLVAALVEQYHNRMEDARVRYEAERQAALDARTPEQVAEDERKRQAAIDKENKRKADLAAAIEKYPFAPAEGLEDEYAAAKGKNTDPYGAGVYRYLEGWASLMESKLAEGKAIVDIAKETSHEADLEGISGFMYGAAVSVLSHFWKHGEDLRRWHNLDTQLGNEGEKANESGGVLNPAVLNIG